MGRPEGNLKDNVAKYLKRLQRKHKLWFYKVHGSGRQKMGIPDLCIVFYGIPVYIELKAKQGEPPTAIQDARMHDIRAAGGYCFMGYTVDDVRDALIASYGQRFPVLKPPTLSIGDSPGSLVPVLIDLEPVTEPRKCRSRKA